VPKVQGNTLSLAAVSYESYQSTSRYILSLFNAMYPKYKEILSLILNVPKAQGNTLSTALYELYRSTSKFSLILSIPKIQGNTLSLTLNVPKVQGNTLSAILYESCLKHYLKYLLRALLYRTKYLYQYLYYYCRNAGITGLGEGRVRFENRKREP
jgi:hypothetical protein